MVAPRRQMPCTIRSNSFAQYGNYTHQFAEVKAAPGPFNYPLTLLSACI